MISQNSLNRKLTGYNWSIDISTISRGYTQKTFKTDEKWPKTLKFVYFWGFSLHFLWIMTYKMLHTWTNNCILSKYIN